MQTVYDRKDRPWTYVHGTWGNEDLLEQYEDLAELDRRYGPLEDEEGTPVPAEQSQGGNG